MYYLTMYNVPFTNYILKMYYLAVQILSLSKKDWVRDIGYVCLTRTGEAPW